MLHNYKDGFKIGFKKARKEGGYTQKSFVENFGNVTIDTVRNWEQGRSIPEFTTIELLCDFFKCDLDYLFGNIEYKTHDHKYICEITGLTEKAVDILTLIKEESADDLPYGSYAFGNKTKKKIIGAGKTRRVINELLENEYERFIVNGNSGIMDNLFAAIDEYMHPFDFEFRVYDKNINISTNNKYKPAVMDRAAGTLTLINEDEIYRNIIMSRITKMLNNLKYDMD